MAKKIAAKTPRARKPKKPAAISIPTVMSIPKDDQKAFAILKVGYESFSIEVSIGGMPLFHKRILVSGDSWAEVQKKAFDFAEAIDVELHSQFKDNEQIASCGNKAEAMIAVIERFKQSIYLDSMFVGAFATDCVGNNIELKRIEKPWDIEL